MIFFTFLKMDDFSNDDLIFTKTRIISKTILIIQFTNNFMKIWKCDKVIRKTKKVCELRSNNS